ncbi:hypothetical protein ACVWY2_002679 [Bradyrhizobium sp. JR6.1]
MVCASDFLPASSTLPTESFSSALKDGPATACPAFSTPPRSINFARLA